MDSDLTANSVLGSTLHDRERRAERQIDKITLLEARRYGIVEKQKKGRIKYTYAGHVFIYDKKRNCAITSYKIDSNYFDGGTKKKIKEHKSGTRFFKPLLIQASAEHASKEVAKLHRDVAKIVDQHKERWTSHTVFVVDMSGSMRDDDVDGARCRADGVWTTLARDFVKKQLEEETCSVFDVVSVVVMQEEARVVISCAPMTYVLYNRLVSFREWDEMRPQGHGFYKPALEKAEELLGLNAHGSCSLSLLFVSDGRPSDHVKTMKTDETFDRSKYNHVQQGLIQILGKIGSRFGRRLNITCIGMAGQDEKFYTLSSMAEEAKFYGAQAVFNRPNLNADSLSKIITSSVASSLISKTELTSLKTGKTRSVRTDVERERTNAPEDTCLNNDWRVFRATSEDACVQNIWKWNSKNGDFAKIIDPRCNTCYREVASHHDYFIENGKGSICGGCKACSFCKRCLTVGSYKYHRRLGECDEMAKARRSGFLVRPNGCPFGFNVAWKKKAFGEGAERLAFKFRFVGKGNDFTGPIFVAKESRFVEDIHESDKDYLQSHRHAYHKSFMRTQAAASRFAKMFNKSIGELNGIPEDSAPKIVFLKPAIFELEDRSVAKSYNILVEPLIPGAYRKFSNNHGGMVGAKRDFASENHGVDLSEAALLLGRQYQSTDAHGTLDAKGIGELEVIDEGSDDESEEESNDESVKDSSLDGSQTKVDEIAELCDEDYLQAFSHFTYVRSGGRLMVVDLQGPCSSRKGRRARRSC